MAGDPRPTDADTDESSALSPGGLAMALTGDRGAAASLLATARTRRGAAEPTNQGLIGEAARRREPVSGPAREPLRGDLEKIATALDQLRLLQRAMLVATQLCDLTHAETATLLDRPAVQVNRVITETIATLGDRYDVRAALEQLTWQSPTAGDIATADSEVARRRHRRRRLLGVGVGAAVLAVIASIAVPLLGPAPPAYARSSGQWTYGLALDRPGWTVAAHQLSDIEELITLTQDNAAGSCQVAAELRTPAAAGLNPLRRVRINGRVGAYATTGDERLIWPIGPATSASASCSRTADDRRTALQTARSLRIEPGPVSLPLRLTDLPLNTRVGWVGERDGHTSISIVNTTGIAIDTERAEVSVYQVSYGTALDNLPATGWRVAERSDRVSICQTVEHLQFCVNGSTGGAASRRQLLRIVDSVEIVPAPGDRAHWLDANEALPQ